MGLHSHSHRHPNKDHHHSNKVKLTFECTADERAYIKILAAKEHLNLSDLILSYLRKDFPRQPNKETIEALEESRKGKLKSYKNLDEFWEAMGIDPNA